MTVILIAGIFLVAVLVIVAFFFGVFIGYEIGTAKPEQEQE